ncbi:bicaudal-D-related protein 2-like isoform X1 [Nothobranchius furzeri]|uniref:bicaudal-D-related protein 2-like isoform X1 n=1 Tax=Nothobranchius furzeri TaxID=105023 RepID=UPI002403CC0C|nr:bicaudal-D-related protein 2-like isoform X1 [Nothobranchius furzeri]
MPARSHVVQVKPDKRHSDESLCPSLLFNCLFFPCVCLFLSTSSECYSCQGDHGLLSTLLSPQREAETSILYQRAAHLFLGQTGEQKARLVQEQIHILHSIHASDRARAKSLHNRSRRSGGNQKLRRGRRVEVDDEEMSTDDSSVTHSEETDSAGELVSVGTRDPSKSDASSEAEGSFQRSCMDRSLPDLIKSGRPLCRRRTVAHVSETLKEVRREVELSRRRSIKLKAQVDKLQENRDGPGWSKHKESVTEEVLSVLGLLHPLVEPEFSQPKLGGGGESRLETAVAQLQIVARKLVISHSKQESKSGTEDSGVLQQALRDRDDAIEKKKAMEAEVLRSKTEMMVLNNHLLEAAQKRLELSLELEAWKEDFQRLLQQLVQMQQQADQAQKKSSRMGILRRINKTPVQRPANCPLPATSTPPTTNSKQIYKIESAGSASPTPSSSSGGSGSSKGTWKLKSKKSRNSRLWYQEQDSDHCKYDDGFQVVSLD